METFYSSKALLKMAGGEGCIPPGSAPEGGSALRKFGSFPVGRSTVSRSTD